MLFNSIDFIVLYLVVLVLFYTLKPKFRWVLLLAASYFFYAYWEPYYLLIILFSTLVDYLVGLQILKKPEAKKWLLGISLFANLGILFVFKYLNFFNEFLAVSLEFLGIGFTPSRTSLLLPVGISYYTFQTLSYTIDLYRDRIKPEPHLGRFALFVSFFPQLVAGPIERARNLLPQFQKIKQKLTYDNFAAGLSQMLWGFIKKTVIADTIRLYVDSIYDKHEIHSPATLFFTSVLFFVQLYCDFSGYTDIALGTARTMGFKLSRNFNLPLFSYSIGEFWRRWHMSLYRWILDYIYAPLRGDDRSDLKRYRNVMIVFFVIGLWHGASFNFVIFGIITGLIVVVEHMLGIHKVRPGNIFSKLLRIGYLFTWGALCLIFFRAESTQQSFAILGTILNPAAYTDLSISILEAGIFVQMMLSVIVFFCVEHFYFKKYDFDHFVKSRSVPVIAFCFALAIVTIILFGVQNEAAFIYFQF